MCCLPTPMGIKRRVPPAAILLIKGHGALPIDSRMKTTMRYWLIGILLCLVFGPRDLCQAGEAADAIQAGSTWQDNAGRTLIILQRMGGTYRGRFTKNDQFIREVTGSVTGDKISWLAKDVSAIKGGPGNNFGTIKDDKMSLNLLAIMERSPLSVTV